MSDEIVLCEGCPGGDDGEGWMPRIALDHGPTDSGSELYVIVGEEIAGMAEGVDAATFEAIRAATFTPQERAALLKVVQILDSGETSRAEWASRLRMAWLIVAIWQVWGTLMAVHAGLWVLAAGGAAGAGISVYVTWGWHRIAKDAP